MRFTLRRATPRDLDTLTMQRRRMFEAIREHTAREHAIGDREYRRWAAQQMKAGRFVAWIVEAADGAPAAGGAVWLQEQQPRPGMPARREPYLLSMFTDPAFRGRGLATRIVREALRWSRRRGFRRMTLHASRFGRGIYRGRGFERTWEMRALL